MKSTMPIEMLYKNKVKFNQSFPLTNYSTNKYSPNLNYLDTNCEQFFQTLSSDVREDLRPSRKHV
jgi:hypothetical protein